MKLLLLVALLGCGARSSQTAKATGSGEVGATCGCGDQHEPGACVEVSCRPGLECGYPCGIKGCDSICMTREDFEATFTNP